MNQQRTRKVITTTPTTMTTLLQEYLISEDPTSIMPKGAKRNQSLGICSIFEPIFKVNKIKKINHLPLIALAALMLLTGPPVKAQEGDSPETLTWVSGTASLVEERLTNAINVADEANLLIKLMESSNDFKSVALTGLYCHEVRTAAELGGSYCNWLNYYTRDKDLNSLTLRAQEARQQAVRMRNAAVDCLRDIAKKPVERSFSLADVIRSNAETIEHDLADGLASQDLHILSQKVANAERIFYDTELLTSRLNNCESVLNAAQEGIKACMEILAAPNWSLVTTHLNQASSLAATIKVRAEECR